MEIEESKNLPVSSIRKESDDKLPYTMEFKGEEFQEPVEQKVFIFLLEESLKKNRFTCQFKSGMEILFKFRMDDKNIKKTKEIVKPIKTDINLSLVKQITITTEFLIKVTVMRRIINDIHFYLSKENLKMDFHILLWCVLLIFRPLNFMLLMFLYLYFFVNMHDLNHNILTKMLYYFSEFVDKDDEKKNLIHLQKTQSGTWSWNLGDFNT